MPNDVFCPRVLRWTIHYILAHLIYVKRSDRNWYCHVKGYSYGYSKLVKLKVGIRGDDCASTEIYSLSHKVTSDASFFTFQALSYSF
jgi:hypothetical protein